MAPCFQNIRPASYVNDKRNHRKRREHLVGTFFWDKNINLLRSYVFSTKVYKAEAWTLKQVEINKLEEYKIVIVC